MLTAISNFWMLQLLRVAWRRFGEDNSFALAGYLAYTGLLSFFPFMVFLVMTGTYIVGEQASMQVVEEMFALAPEQVSQTLKPVFETIIASKSGVAALIGAAVGLWAGSNAFEAARIGFNLAYDVKEDRPFLRRRLQSLTLAATAASVFVCLAFLIVLWPLLASYIDTGDGGIGSVGFDIFYFLRYAIGLPMFCLLLVVLHTTLPRGKRDRYHIHVYTENNEHWTISVVPGVVATTLIWFIGATLFSLYLRYSPSFAGNYGAMAGVVITLLFFYMSSVVIFLGAQINIAREELRRKRTVAGEALAEAETYDEGDEETFEEPSLPHSDRLALEREGP
ncbi:MAG: YihY/virulence factor BrkB family protein [Rhodobacteraceae bacterium]|nr:YihY/virulence factor BrkB family protein [Paracoccaceae bacterium]